MSPRPFIEAHSAGLASDFAATLPARRALNDGSDRHAGAGDVAGYLLDGGMVMLIRRRRGDSGRGGMAALAAEMSVDNATRMAVEARGLLSVVVDASAARRLGLSHMPRAVEADDDRPYYLASIEAASCSGTGISAADRALTIRTAGRREATRHHLRSPGHVMPILVTRGPAGRAVFVEEAYWRLRDLADCDVVAWSDVLNDSGDLASARECEALAAEIGMPALWI